MPSENACAKSGVSPRRKNWGFRGARTTGAYFQRFMNNFGVFYEFSMIFGRTTRAITVYITTFYLLLHWVSLLMFSRFCIYTTVALACFRFTCASADIFEKKTLYKTSRKWISWILIFMFIVFWYPLQNQCILLSAMFCGVGRMNSPAVHHDHMQRFNGPRSPYPHPGFVHQQRHELMMHRSRIIRPFVGDYAEGYHPYGQKKNFLKAEGAC